MKRFNPYSIVLLCFLSSLFAVTLVASGFIMPALKHEVKEGQMVWGVYSDYHGVAPTPYMTVCPLDNKDLTTV